MVHNFISDVTDGSCRLAEMRGSNKVELNDLALYLSISSVFSLSVEKNWDISVEGYSINTTNSDRTVSL